MPEARELEPRFRLANIRRLVEGRHGGLPDTDQTPPHLHRFRSSLRLLFFAIFSRATRRFVVSVIKDKN
jgi:hypothetical protein